MCVARFTAEAARSRILDAASRRFAAVGYEATSIQDIASDIECSKAAIFHHFHTKATILRELIEPTAIALQALVIAIEELPASQRASAAAHGFVEHVLNNRHRLSSYPATMRSAIAIPELEDLGLQALSMRLMTALTGGSPGVNGKTRAIAFINGVAAAARELVDAPIDELRPALKDFASDLFHDPKPRP